MREELEALAPDNGALRRCMAAVMAEDPECDLRGFVVGWSACRAEMLHTAPASAPAQSLADLHPEFVDGFSRGFDCSEKLRMAPGSAPDTLDDGDAERLIIEATQTNDTYTQHRTHVNLIAAVNAEKKAIEAFQRTIRERDRLGSAVIELQCELDELRRALKSEPQG